MGLLLTLSITFLLHGSSEMASFLDRLVFFICSEKLSKWREGEPLNILIFLPHKRFLKNLCPNEQDFNILILFEGVTGCETPGLFFLLINNMTYCFGQCRTFCESVASYRVPNKHLPI